jgi:hypothetical protein
MSATTTLYPDMTEYNVTENKIFSSLLQQLQPSDMTEGCLTKRVVSPAGSGTAIIKSPGFKKQIQRSA